MKNSNKSKFRKNDLVVVIAGKDRGRQGKILKILPAANRVIVERVNMIKRHTRPNPSKNIAGGISEKEAAIHISNVMLVNPATGKGDRVGFKFLEAQGATPARKVRFFKSNGEVVDV